MRTLLLISLLALSFGLTAFSLLAVRFTLHRQIQRDLTSDLRHSVDTFLNLERQRREMLAREAALLADLPSLKALMTTQDVRTIQDGGKDFWQIGGSDLFQLYDRGGRLMAAYGPGMNDASERAMQTVLEQPQETRTVALGDKAYEVIAQPLSFGSRTEGTVLGYVVLGAAIDRQVARQVSQAAAAEVAFTIDGKAVAATLPASLDPLLNTESGLRTLPADAVMDVRLKDERYLAAVMPLSEADAHPGRVELVVLKSYRDAARLVSIINRWLLGLGLLALIVSMVVAVSISRQVTRPLEALVVGARALGRGDFKHPLSAEGTAEIRELAQAFGHMRLELESSQRALVDSERLATIGRMASSISHDLRHYLSAMYANAEFLSLATTSQSDREELILEVENAVHGMTNLLDSLLGFSRTGQALVRDFESIPYLIERAVGLLKAHPEARSLDVCLDHLPAIEAWVDATKIVRAVFNLLLNACQAANRGAHLPGVTIYLAEKEDEIVIRIADNGPGISGDLARSIFEPFVSSARENGTGLGLTLAQHIAQEHGGLVRLDESAPGLTVFSLTLNKQALQRLPERQSVVLKESMEHIDLRSTDDETR